MCSDSLNAEDTEDTEDTEFATGRKSTVLTAEDGWTPVPPRVSHASCYVPLIGVIVPEMSPKPLPRTVLF